LNFSRRASSWSLIPVWQPPSGNRIKRPGKGISPSKAESGSDSGDSGVLSMVNRTNTPLMSFYQKKKREKGIG
jgi:hypothetical protein